MGRTSNGTEGGPTWNLRSKRKLCAVNTNGTSPVNRNSKGEPEETEKANKQQEEQPPVKIVKQEVDLITTNENVVNIEEANKEGNADGTDAESVNPVVVHKEISKEQIKVEPSEFVKIEQIVKLENNNEQNKSAEDTNLDISSQKVNVSATLKALERLENLKKKGLKKKTKMSPALRRQKLNNRLNKILTPKSAPILLHELKPGCTFKFLDHPGVAKQMFVVQIEHKGKVLATGQGTSKSSAKSSAAENAIKIIVKEKLAPKTLEKCNNEEENRPCSEDDLHWAGLASFALYKMFNEWNVEGYGSPFSSSPQKKQLLPKTPPVKKDLPPDAEKLHPSILLNIMRPGLSPVEVERTIKDKVPFVTMGYEIDGQMYRGTATNKKEAKKGAAKSALEALYGLRYSE